MINKGDNLRRKILAANWKMNMRRDEAKSLLSSIKKMEIKWRKSTKQNEERLVLNQKAVKAFWRLTAIFLSRGSAFGFPIWLPFL